MPAKSPKGDAAKPAQESVIIDTTNAVIEHRYAAYVTAGGLEVGLRKRTLLDDRLYREFIRTAAIQNRLQGLAEELGYPEKLVDDELVQFLYHSSQAVKAVGVEYAAYGDDWETIKRKFAKYIATPGIDDLWNEINKAINNLERNPDLITSPNGGSETTDPK